MKCQQTLNNCLYNKGVILDLIEIKGLKLATRIGVHAWEKEIDQTLSIDIILHLDLSQCQDQLARTIDYDALAQRISTCICSQSFNLIETVAEEIAVFVKSSFEVQKVVVSVSKPHALRNTENVRVQIER